MTQLQDQLNAAIANLKNQHGVTEDQAKAIAAQAVQPLQDEIQNILVDDKADDEKLADVTAAVTNFAASLGGTSNDSGSTGTGTNTGSTGTDTGTTGQDTPASGPDAAPTETADSAPSA